MLETHLAVKTTKKKQKSNTPETPACTEAMLYRETRRAPTPPDASF
jgi:hypothetical protein